MLLSLLELDGQRIIAVKHQFTLGAATRRAHLLKRYLMAHTAITPELASVFLKRFHKKFLISNS
ncbi:MAG: hypothetical protein HFJ87_09285 [Muribaculaceae bacterium]|nr:hypothetical protein [Muribaculaceae bacterium]